MSINPPRRLLSAGLIALAAVAVAVTASSAVAAVGPPTKPTAHNVRKTVTPKLRTAFLVASPSAVTGIKVVTATTTAVTLAWNASAGATGYYLYRSGVRLSRTTSTSATWAGLNCSSPYRFSVQAYGAVGTSARTDFWASTKACGAAAPADTTPPTQPGSFATGAATQSSISLSWSASSDNVRVAGYDVYLDGGKVATTTGTSYALSGLACGTSHSLAVDAYDAAGNRSSRASLTAATAACTPPPPTADTTPPSQPGSFAAGTATQSSIVVGWNASSDNVGVVGYDVYLDGAKVTAVAGLSYAFSGLACGSSHSLAVDAYDAAGNISPRATVTAATSACIPPPPPADTTPPSQPGSFAAGSVTQTSILVSWSASSDNVGVSGYDVYLDGAKVAAVAATSYSFAGLACGSSHSVAVDAYDAAGNRSARSSVTASTSACSPPPPVGGSTWYLSPNGSDSNPCTQAAPCRTFNRAYSVASPGQTVQVGAGSYPGEALTASPKSSGGRVVFAPAPGATAVMTGELRTSGQNHIEIDGIDLGGIYFSGGSDDIVLRNVDMTTFFIRAASNIGVYGGSVGGTCDGTSGTLGSGTSSSRATNIVIDGVRFHDITRSCAPAGSHVECLFVQESSYVTVTNSTFTNCSVMDVYFHAIGGGKNPDHVTFTNNVLDTTEGGYDSVIWRADSGEVLDTYLVQGNSFAQTPYIENAAGSTVTSFRQCSNTGRPFALLAGTSGFTGC